jgi:hypothetical protein
MKGFRWKNCCVLLGVLAVIPGAVGATPRVVNDPDEGQKLARELRSIFPAEEIAVKGVLRISAPDREPQQISVESKVVVEKESWTSTYTARRAGADNEVLSVRHFADKPNEYEWRRGSQTQKLNGTSATNAFAGSDFMLLDLGLDFFHWPTQMITIREMRKGRGCDVLESRPAKVALYSRVLSWIDQESRAQGQPGLLMAEAYDANGRPLKEFEIKGFKKIGDRWQVREMEIRNRQTRTATRLTFEFAGE